MLMFRYDHTFIKNNIKTQPPTNTYYCNVLNRNLV